MMLAAVIVGIVLVPVTTRRGRFNRDRAELALDNVSNEPESIGDVSGSLRQLLALEPTEVVTQDFARLNFLAATGLPGAENLDLDRSLRMLDEWAEHVSIETDRHLYRFRRNLGEFRDSEAYFRMLMLIVVLQEDFGVHFNPQRIHEPDFRNPRDLFIHGFMDESNGGTCVSMPVLYVAVGRRLGYPLRLVVTKGHVFARWDEGPGGERFNIEGTNRGLDTPDDGHYKHWPYELTEAERCNDWYLRSLEPAEEFAIFLMQRGHCLEDNGRLSEAEEAYALARQYAPKSIEAQRSFDLLRAQRSASQEIPAAGQHASSRSEAISAILQQQEARLKDLPQIRHPSPNSSND